MKKFFILSVAATLICSLSFATIRRVGYFGPGVSGVDYASFAEAHTAASVGDTIMMMPGSKINNTTITKALIVIGPGYYLSQNENLQANTLSMDTNGSTGNTITKSASGSIFIGCVFGNSTGGNTAFTLADEVENIIFRRCWFNNFVNNTTGGIYVSGNSVKNIMFQQCSFKGVAFYADKPITNVSFFNSFFSDNNYYSTYIISDASSGLFQNCIFEGQYRPLYLSGTWQINNSIIQSTSFNGSGITFQNCIATGTQIPAGNGNQQNKTWESIFTLTGSTDAKYTLKAGGPAIGAGIGGTNCGIFGGTTPYKLSGIPSVPTIYAISSPQGNTPTVNTVQVNLSTRSNN